MLKSRNKQNAKTKIELSSLPKLEHILMLSMLWCTNLPSHEPLAIPIQLPNHVWLAEKFHQFLLVLQQLLRSVSVSVFDLTEGTPFVCCPVLPLFTDLMDKSNQLGAIYLSHIILADMFTECIATNNDITDAHFIDKLEKVLMTSFLQLLIANEPT